MIDAGSWFLGEMRSHRISRDGATGSGAQSVGVRTAGETGRPAGKSIFSPPKALAFAFAVVSLFLFCAGSASAAFQHQQTSSFGADGTSGSTFSNPKSLAFQQESQRLYVYDSSDAAIYAFHRDGPGTYSKVAGGWPKTGVVTGFGDPDIAVDNTGGSSKGNLYFSPDGDPIFGYSSAAVALAPFETPSGEKCGVAVDGNGKVWVGNYGGPKAEQYAPTGGAPNFSISTSSPCDVEVDRSNNDVYVAAYGGGVTKYTAASGYATEIPVPGSGGDAKMAINPINHHLYLLSGGQVKVYDTSTLNVVETFATNFGSGIAVDDASDTVYLLGEGKVQEWRAVIAPTATTGEPVANKTVSGSITLDGGGNVTECFFEFSTEETAAALEANPTHPPCEPAAPYSADQPSVTAELPGLEGETTYYYRLVAANANATSRGEIKSITPHNVSTLRTEPATAITRTTAQLNASYIGTNEPTKYLFEWEKGEVSCPCLNKTTEKTEVATVGATGLSETISGLEAGKVYSYRIVAENAKGVSKAGTVHFTTSPAVTGLVTKPATEIMTTTALVHGELDPDNYATTYYFEWGKDTLYGQATPLPPGNEITSTGPGKQEVTVELTNLEPGTVYHYRIVAKNETGTTVGNDQTLETHQPPSITSISATNISATGAELTATINPNGYATTYYFEYGTSPEYGLRVPIPDGNIPAVDTVESVVEPISGLEERTYHFHIVAENEWGKVESEDQTLDFNVPVGCPNQLLRQQTGAAYLPDCRAYELVTAGRAGGAAIFPYGPTSPWATGPSTFAYATFLNQIPGAGESQNASLYPGDMYVATRTQTGWVSKYVGPKGSESLGQSSAPGGEYGGQLSLLCCEGLNYPNAVPTDKTMTRFLIWDRREVLYGAGGTHDGTNAPRVYDNEGNWLGSLPTGVDKVPGADKTLDQGGWIGSARISGDASHYLFSSINLAFTPNGISESPGSVYDNDIANETITLISKNEAGEDIPQDKTAGVGEDFLRVPAVSEDGSHILISASSPPKEPFNPITPLNHLYMAINDGNGTAESDYEHFDISVDKNGKNVGVKFETMSNDGSKVYFTTDKQMTSDDTDSSIDIYMWSDSTHELTRISDSGNLPGNTDSCTATWTSGCNAIVVPRRVCGEGGGCKTDTRRSDFPWASETGEIYFYSPEELDGARGFPNKRNLYVYRDGRPQYVTTLEPNQDVERINVSPDGSNMAFITRTKLTAYDNAGHSEMYLYEPAARSLKCVSCLPSGDPPTSDVLGSQNGWFMSFDGRTFFSTKDGLVDRDANKTTDVYEYVAGRPQLISTGTGDDPNNAFQAVGLIGVSGDGSDAMFGTFNTLVPQDENGDQYKIYDARSAGGFPTSTVKPPCEAADECHGEDSVAPAPPEIGSSGSLGAGGNFHIASKHAKKLRHRKRHHKGRKHRTSRGSRNG